MGLPYLGPDYMANFNPANRAEILLRLHDELESWLKY